MPTHADTASTGNPYWDDLLAQARHLREVNSRLAYGLLEQLPDLSDQQRAHVFDAMESNLHAAERLEQQVLWHRHMAGESLTVVPNGPAWTD